LAEGFSSVKSADGERAFHIALSVEKDPAAHSTLRLRAFLRQFAGNFPTTYYNHINSGDVEPDWSKLYPRQWAAAEVEAWRLELGKEDPAERLNARIDAIREESDGNTILIGGPPCQAYSLVGRARNSGVHGYVASKDNKHFLYQEYIRILDRLRPAAFVMENVKGMLSSSVDGENLIFDQVLKDLRGAEHGSERYRLIALTPRSRKQVHFGSFRPKAADFVIRAEDFGVPQARHRVIIVGLRADLAADLPDTSLADVMVRHTLKTTVGHVLEGMPKLRSGLSRGLDTGQEWKRVITGVMSFVADIETNLPGDQHLAFITRAAGYHALFRDLSEVPDREVAGTGIAADCPSDLRDWLTDKRLKTLPTHVTRGHMTSDLARYFFAAVFAEVTGRSPKASDFPEELAPQHQNWSTGKFADRFRVQISSGPSTTVTSHISKDGHYFIHPDPIQCRSLSVREAARLQTFPDNYVFKGNRTQQYVQVGNAVPPLLARWIGEALWSILNARNLRDDAEQAHIGLSSVG
jgi:DNA (cytosine-5)-methyltransferase 1